MTQKSIWAIEQLLGNGRWKPDIWHLYFNHKEAVTNLRDLRRKWSFAQYRIVKFVRTK